MKVQTSITRRREAVEAIDEIAGADASPSQIIERAVREFVAARRRRQREARDLAILIVSPICAHREGLATEVPAARPKA